MIDVRLLQDFKSILMNLDGNLFCNKTGRKKNEKRRTGAQELVFKKSHFEKLDLNSELGSVRKSIKKSKKHSIQSLS